MSKAQKKAESKFAACLGRMEEALLQHAKTAVLLTSDSASTEPAQRVFGQSQMIMIALNGGVSSGASPFHLHKYVASLVTDYCPSDKLVLRFNSAQPFAMVELLGGDIASASFLLRAVASSARRLARAGFSVVHKMSITEASGSRVVRCASLDDESPNRGCVGFVLPQGDHPVFQASASSTGAVPPIMLFFPDNIEYPPHMMKTLSTLTPIVQLMRSALSRTPIVVPDPEALLEYIDSTSKDRASSSSCGSSSRVLKAIEVHEVPGAFVVSDFLSDSEHDSIYSDMLGDEGCGQRYDWEKLARRTVAHFSRRFYYGANRLGETFGDDLGKNTVPKFFQCIKQRLVGISTDCSVVFHNEGVGWPVASDFECDQLTVNCYRYDASTVSGIAHHVDAHTPFDDVIFAVSLGSHTVMEFKRWDQQESSVGLFLPPRSLLIMTGEARYCWTHSISEARVDYINEQTPPLVRGHRVSLTWRRGRALNTHSRTTCPCPVLCDAPDAFDAG